MQLKLEDLQYFKKRLTENNKFWSRFPTRPNLKNATVGEIGSGYGNLCIDMAISGAKEVIGFDLEKNRLISAKLLLKKYYPDLVKIIKYKNHSISKFPKNCFDYIYSFSTFEHIMDLRTELKAIKNSLKPGGRLYAGFGPLWNSPFGDHKLISKIPWLHLWKSKDSNLMSLGLNKLSLAKYKEIFYNSGMQVIYFKTNASHNPISKLLSIFRITPLLDEYFSHNIYCILEKI